MAGLAELQTSVDVTISLSNAVCATDVFTENVVKYGSQEVLRASPCVHAVQGGILRMALDYVAPSTNNGETQRWGPLAA
jgi:hypothetical protein